VRAPAEIKLDVPTDAFLPADYVTREELRLEAYRRLAAVTTHAEVDDIAAEWEDRYGPVPPAAEALLAVGRLRAECHRVGVREVVVTSRDARLSPVRLKTSEAMRLKRLLRDAVYKEDAGVLVVPIRKAADAVTGLAGLLQQLIPPAGSPADSPAKVGAR
jgi:transcription-repair coupling factor (superfamily II helicase)